MEEVTRVVLNNRFHGDIEDLNNMTFVWNNFQRMFPEKAEHVISYERSGSRMITLHMDDGTILSFLYYTPSKIHGVLYFLEVS